MDLAVFTTNEWILLGVIFFVSVIFFPIFFKLSKKYEKKVSKDISSRSFHLSAIYFIYAMAFMAGILFIPIIVIGNIFGFLPLH